MEKPPHRHHPLHHSGLHFPRRLQSFDGPSLHHRGNLRVVDVEKSETCHVDASVAIRLQVERKKIL